MRVRRAGEGRVRVPSAEPGEGAASGLVLFLPAAFRPSGAAARTRSSLLGFFLLRNGKSSYFWSVGGPWGGSPGGANGGEAPVHLLFTLPALLPRRANCWLSCLLRCSSACLLWPRGPLPEMSFKSSTIPSSLEAEDKGSATVAVPDCGRLDVRVLHA